MSTLVDREVDSLRVLAERLMRGGATPQEAWVRAFRERSNKTSLVRRAAEAMIEAGMPEDQAWRRAIARGAIK